MTRPRAPRAAAVAGAIARILGLGASVVLLANLIYESVNWGKTLGLSVSVVRHQTSNTTRNVNIDAESKPQAVIALLVDGSELTGLLDSTRTIPRVSPSCLVCEDLFVLCLAIPSIFLIILGNIHETAADAPYPWEGTDSLSLIVTIAICILRGIILIWSCVDCCYVLKRPRRPESVLTPVHSIGELRDVAPSR
ncbi:hypothetical protein F5Y00DRAFT_268321 [Daldinia vernicosa]|uniref:uncharacterized protein n=1 Tax=Daldinia vernicosa TaxID=114800 RepID=UPI0020088483|nr:uncharacterized protein F5Y00DRAFT_268321 [Daldinia vernicosa]KAI0850570.1 hypothetical protein F5Y00DRAFT_268321 [Daldinia vernicosa]